MVRRIYIKFLSLGIAISSWFLTRFQRAMAYQAIDIITDLFENGNDIIILTDDCHLDEAYENLDEYHTRESLRTWKQRTVRVPNDN